MQYSKLGASLSASISGAIGGEVPVYVRFAQPLTPQRVGELRSHGIPAEVGEKIISATVPRRALDALSELNWVRSIELSGQSKLFGR
jgi:hypothetical protein